MCDSLEQLLVPAAFNEIRLHEERAVAARAEFLRTGRAPRQRPLKLGAQFFQGWYGLWVWDLRPCFEKGGGVPVRYHRQRPEAQEMDLAGARFAHDYHDLEVRTDFVEFGLPGGGNHKPVTVLMSNGSSWYENEEQGVAEIEVEKGTGKMHEFAFVPFWPFHASAFFFVVGKKVRRILNLKAPQDGFGVNEQREEYHTAKLDLVKVCQLIQRILWLHVVAAVMVGWGWDVGLVMGWVDLHSAYNQERVWSRRACGRTGHRTYAPPRTLSSICCRRPRSSAARTRHAASPGCRARWCRIATCVSKARKTSACKIGGGRSWPSEVRATWPS